MGRRSQKEEVEYKIREYLSEAVKFPTHTMPINELAIANTLGKSRNTIRKYLGDEDSALRDAFESAKAKQREHPEQGTTTTRRSRNSLYATNIQLNEEIARLKAKLNQQQQQADEWSRAQAAEIILLREHLDRLGEDPRATYNLLPKPDRSFSHAGTGQKSRETGYRLAALEQDEQEPKETSEA